MNEHRFGSTDELGLFEMTDGGLQAVPDASGLFTIGVAHDTSPTPFTGARISGSVCSLALALAIAGTTSFEPLGVIEHAGDVLDRVRVGRRVPRLLRPQPRTE